MIKIDDTWYQKPKNVPTHESAGGVVVRSENGKLWVALVCERGESSLVLPKGHIEAGESPEQAAMREVAEEAGLTRLHLIGPLGKRERLDFKKRSWKITHYYLFLTDEKHGHPQHVQYLPPRWYPLDALPELFWPEQAQLLQESRQKIHDLLAGRQR